MYSKWWITGRRLSHLGQTWKKMSTRAKNPFLWATYCLVIACHIGVQAQQQVPTHRPERQERIELPSEQSETAPNMVLPPLPPLTPEEQDRLSSPKISVN